MTTPRVPAPEYPMVPPTATFEAIARDRWAALGDPGHGRLSGPEVEELVATGDPVSLAEVGDVYVPLLQLLGILAGAKAELHQRISGFLAEDRHPAPFVVGIAGSVAVGKSTTARILQALLRRSPGAPAVDLLTTDGFLFPNAELESRGLMARKGFPESYDQRRLLGTLAAIRRGDPEVVAPVYSHTAYDIVPGQYQVFRQPAIVIVEGLNVLQVVTQPQDRGVVSDFFDFSIYVDAAEEDIARWFGERLVTLCRTVFTEPGAYFHQMASLSSAEVSAIAARVWAETNVVNLRQNIAPTRSRAHLILEKGRDHHVQRILVRRP
jgi:type I pantothenate kinase